MRLENSLYKKIVNTNLKQKKKKKSDSDCNFYNFLLLVHYPNKFVVVCICIVCNIYGDMGHSLVFLQHYSNDDVTALSKQYGSVLC